MSARTTRRRYSAIAVLPLAIAAAGAPAATASVVPRDPGSMYRPAEVVPSSWPDEESGYPEYADQPVAGSQYRVVTQRDRFDTTSIALGALGGSQSVKPASASLWVCNARRDHVLDPGSDHA